jgi:ketosteroid isomerase-like protein
MSQRNVEIVARAIDAFSRGRCRDVRTAHDTGDRMEDRTGRPVGAVWELRDGKIWRLRAYLDHAEALRTAGLAG